MIAVVGICASVFAQEPDERVESLRKKLQEPEKETTIVSQIEGAPPVPQQTPVQPAQPVQPELKKPTVVVEPQLAPNEKARTAEGGAESPQPAPDALADGEKVWVLDPRDSLSANELANDGFEMTGITINRNFVVAGFASEQDEQESKPLWTKNVPVKIPIMHRTRQIALDKQTAARARAVLAKLESLSQQAKQLEAESREALKEWNAIVTQGTPYEILAADSPSLPENQSAGNLNREAPKDGLEAGKGVSFKLEE